ncbi:hypothetical protein ACLI08_07285 [Flavobacterium sp. RNTU_13]|uniref:hypothetical protein n=1 Tax=Flavobacterium sp. RNTU_13 TaxID=3375145 RepID=UPI0039857BCB
MKNVLMIFMLMISFSSFAQDADELFSWETAKVNNKLPLTLTYKEFEGVYKKKADSITAPLPEQICGAEAEKSAKMVYYRGARYEMDNGVMNFRELDFSPRKNMFFQQKDDWFDHTTSLKGFSKTYPIAVSAAEEEQDDDDTEPWKVVTLLPQEKELGCLWVFYFKKGKLKKIKCEFSCN